MRGAVGVKLFGQRRGEGNQFSFSFKSCEMSDELWSLDSEMRVQPLKSTALIELQHQRCRQTLSLKSQVSSLNKAFTFFL